MLAATIAVEPHRRAVQGLRRGGDVRRDPAGRRRGRDPAAAGRRRRRRATSTRSARRCGGAARRATSRRASTGSIEPMSAVDVSQKIGARRRLHAAHHVSRRADDRGDGAALRVARLRHGARLRRRGRATRRRSSDLDPQATDLEGYLFPETYALPRGVPASRLVAHDGRSLPRDLHRRAAAAAPRRRG